MPEFPRNTKYPLRLRHVRAYLHLESYDDKEAFVDAVCDLQADIPVDISTLPERIRGLVQMVISSYEANPCTDSIFSLSRTYGLGIEFGAAAIELMDRLYDTDQAMLDKALFAFGLYLYTGGTAPDTDGLSRDAESLINVLIMDVESHEETVTEESILANWRDP